MSSIQSNETPMYTSQGMLSTKVFEEPSYSTIIKPTIVQEEVRPHIVEHIQPVIYRETVQPTIVHQTLPIMQHVIAAPVITSSEVRAPIYRNTSSVAPISIENAPAAQHGTVAFSADVSPATQQFARVMYAIERKRFKLSPVKASDRSKPMIEDGVKIKHYDRYNLNKAIQHPGKLRHVPSVKISDRSQPVLEASFKLRQVNNKAFLDNMLSGAEFFYSRIVNAGKNILSAGVETSQSALNTGKNILSAGVETSQSVLNTGANILSAGVETSQSVLGAGKDMAGAVLSSGMQKLSDAAREPAALIPAVPVAAKSSITPESHQANVDLLAQIADNRAKLHHVSIKDKSKPFIPSAEALAQAKVSSQMWRQVQNKEKQVQELSNKFRATVRSFNHVSFANDRSKPAYLPYHVNILHNAHRELVEDLNAQSAESLHQHLHSVDASSIDDRSAPRVPVGKRIDLHKIDRQALMKEVVQHAQM